MRDLHTLDKYRDRDFERRFGRAGDAGNGAFRVPVGGKTMDGVEHRIDGGWDMILAFPPCVGTTLRSTTTPIIAIAWRRNTRTLFPVLSPWG